MMLVNNGLARNNPDIIVYYLGNWLEGLMRTTRNLRQDSQDPGHDSNLVPPE
jgi:hypothetical protein